MRFYRVVVERPPHFVGAAVKLLHHVLAKDNGLRLEAVVFCKP